MRMICATLHCAGMYPLSKTALNSCVRNCIPIVGSSLRILPMMRSYLGNFLGSSLLMISWTSVLLRCLIGASSWYGVSRSWIRSFSSSGEFPKGWGWKTCSKCLAKAWTSSALFLAQVPCDVLSGGEDFGDLFDFLRYLPQRIVSGVCWSEALQKNVYAVVFISPEE
jgi:hypothetical protein